MFYLEFLMGIKKSIINVYINKFHLFQLNAFTYLFIS